MKTLIKRIKLKVHNPQSYGHLCFYKETRKIQWKKEHLQQLMLIKLYEHDIKEKVGHRLVITCTGEDFLNINVSFSTLLGSRFDIV